MTTSHVEYPRVTSWTAWLSACMEVLIKEKKFTRLRDQVKAEWRRLHVQSGGMPVDWLLEAKT